MAFLMIFSQVSHHITESVLVKILNDTSLHIDAVKITVVVMLDPSAAFKAVEHSILLDRLENSMGS